MVKKLLFVWLLGVVAFFSLWAVLAWVVRRISEKKEADRGDEEAAKPEAQEEASTPENAGLNESAPESEAPEG